MAKKGKKVIGFLTGILGVIFMGGTSMAFNFNTDVGEIDITGRVYSQGSWRTQDSKGFTSPKTAAGDFIQHRNLFQMEVKDKVSDFLSVFLSGRFVYEGLYDYGAEQFRKFGDKGYIDSKLREGYVDLNFGPGFLRVGRQNLSWGESDLFRLLDGINPVDNTFGLFFEDLDERRIPIDMARMNLGLGKVGPFESLTLEGFLASGKTQSPVADFGTPYALAAPPSPVSLRSEEPKIEDFRGGGRILGLTKGVTWSLGHYWSYPDNPTPIFKYSAPSDALSTFLQLSFPRQQTTGGSFSFFTGLEATQTVVRGELAYTWDEGVFVPSKSIPVGSGTVSVPGIGLINPGVPVPLQGEIQKVGVFKWVFGLDNNIWIRPLNSRNTFFVSLQAFGRHIAKDWSDDIRLPVNEFPSGNFVQARQNEYQATAVINTKYLDGNLTPEVAMAYDVMGAWFVQPSLKYRWKDWEGMLRYSYVDGTYYNIGFFNDRSQISLRLTYLFK